MWTDENVKLTWPWNTCQLLRKNHFPVNAFEFFTSPTILHNLIHTGKNIKSLPVLNEFLNFTPTIFDITLVILLSPWYTAASRWDHGNRWKHFSENIRLTFLVMIDWLLFLFCWLFMVSRYLNIIYSKFINQSSFDEAFPCDNPGLARLSYVNIFQYSRTQWSKLKYVD